MSIGILSSPQLAQAGLSTAATVQSPFNSIGINRPDIHTWSILCWNAA